MSKSQSDGLRIVWAPVNQAWFVMWNDSLLRIFVNKEDAVWYVDDLRRQSVATKEE
jgi:hypothetical protein